ncbi:hypothetical protein ASD02_13535 [Ensifer sp. Root1252]|nr:hypothetical protein ASD02_13535 [Ensifer sp. Root1252]KRC58049.1 hypothetical protein ASE32_16770 [Ensifer sp. Root231]KRC93323.1 hypothetical protein ASE47_10615 [Ensifer sp. Root258]
MAKRQEIATRLAIRAARYATAGGGIHSVVSFYWGCAGGGNTSWMRPITPENEKALQDTRRF